MTLAPDGDSEMLAASVAFHLHAGVEHVTIVGVGAEKLSGVLERFLAAGCVTLREGGPPTQTEPVGQAVWKIEAAAGEFWWPRGGSLDEVLGTIPQSYDAVQALERTMLRSDGEPFFEHAALRLVPTTPVHDVAWRPARRLVRRGSAVQLRGNEPEPRVLRLWYPIEVLCLRNAQIEGMLQQAFDAGALVEDTRLRDALRSLREPANGGWLVPSTDGKRVLAFPSNSPTDDALFALEAAAAGDVDVLEARELLDTLSGRLNSVERLILVRFEARLRAVRREVRRWLRRGRSAS